MWMMIAALGFVACVWIAFGWFTIGNSGRRVRGGLFSLSMTCLFAPLFLVKLGEQYGFIGVQIGLTVLFGLLAGAFFFVALGWTGRPTKVRKIRTLSEDPDLF
ncbi:hypothetical protein PJK55_10475 [Exiguobacterium sp. MMG028]|uniref:hypothetical protein n=1 Tax=Exiguobacterium sp. MMG028 TaxID=3021979 RepID=UPI0022FDDE1E|nr:hypothetical protein [Exiguobacterium sp. MMG028]MDA5561159.1 hypothetical protein [Exiguobacterium sp. MMG028]